VFLCFCYFALRPTNAQLYYQQLHLKYLCNLVNKATFVHNLLLVYLSIYMFRATVCPSSGETTVFVRYLVLIILCGWMIVMQRGSVQFHSTLHTRQSSTQNNKYWVPHRYSYFSWWWAHSRPKHVERRNKHTKKNCEPSWLYLQDYTGMDCQQNINTWVT
jgi:hypothetical protein